jgi:hypothetical protein
MNSSVVDATTCSFPLFPATALKAIFRHVINLHVVGHRTFFTLLTIAKPSGSRRSPYTNKSVSFYSARFVTLVSHVSDRRDIKARNLESICTGRFIIFSVITNIYNKKPKGPTLIELFTATGKLKKGFDN